MLDDVLATIAQQVGEALSVSSCDIHEYDAATRRLTYVACWSRDGVSQLDLDYIGTVSLVDERTGYDLVVDKRQTLVLTIDDFDQDDPERARMVEWHEKSCVDTPLIFAGEVIGVLGLTETRRVRRFSSQDLELLKGLAVPAAIAIHNARQRKAQEDRTRRLAALVAASRALASTIDIDEVLKRVVDEAAAAVSASESTIWEYDEDSEMLIYRAVHERPGGMPVNMGPLGTAWSLAQWGIDYSVFASPAVKEEHISDPELSAEQRAAMRRYNDLAQLTVPLLRDGRPLGILRVYDNERERQFSAAERELMAALGELAGGAIYNARLFDHQQQRSRQLVSLFEASRRIAASFDIGAILSGVRDEVARLVDEHEADVEVLLRAADSTYLSFASAEQAPARGLTALEQRAVSELSARQETVEQVASLVVPFVSRGQAQGFVAVRSRRLRRFGDDAVELVQIVATQTAAALENASLYRRNEHLAITDGLTGLYNRRYFSARLQQECVRARHSRAPLSLLMLDIDDFKRFNDEFGHLLGDQALRDVAAILQTDLRRGVDLAARYGGEEFVVILPRTPLYGAAVFGGRLQRQVTVVGAGRSDDNEATSTHQPADSGASFVGERIRSQVAATRFSGRDGRRYAHITVSIGIAACDAHLASADDLLQAVDKALYLAKKRGKNRVEVFV
ncbi:MAG: diguanylate cyclase [Thermoleophilia bacterium]